MAINYTNLFTAVGKAIKAANYYKSVFATMKSNGQGFFQEIADQDLDYIGDGTSGAVSSHISGLSAGCAYWQNKVTELLLDPTLVCNELAITQRSLSNVLPALYLDMVTNVQSIEERLAAPTLPATLVGTGNGSLLISQYLDDISNPVSNPSASNMNYLRSSGANSVTSQLPIADTVYARCTNADAEGEESFTLFGNSAYGGFEEHTEGLGGSVSIQTILQGNQLSNGDFETYSAGFTGWTIVDAGGTLVQETSLMYRGASAARINTLANADTFTFDQTLAEPLTRGKGYFVGIRVKSVAAESSNSVAFTFQLFNGVTAITPAYTSTVSITTTNWGTAFALVVVPQTIDPNDLLTLRISGSPTADGVDGLIFDDAFLVEATYFNGLAFAVQNGSTRFRLGDLFSSAVVFSSDGVIQDFFRKTYGIQLPSLPSGDNTIADSLAT